MNDDAPPLLSGITLPSLAEIAAVGDPLVHAKIESPWTDQSWFVIAEAGDGILFGLSSEIILTLGIFNAVELTSIRGPNNARLQRDQGFKPTPLSVVRASLKRAPGPSYEPEEARVEEFNQSASIAQKMVGAASPPDARVHPAVKLVETRLIHETEGYTPMQISTPHQAAAVLKALIGDADREHFAVLLLNAKNWITHAHIASTGTLQSALIHPREIFTSAILAKSAAVVLCHNHPSGNLSPSQEDHDSVARLTKAGEILGISVLDALIVGPGHEFYADSIGGVAPLPTRKRRKPGNSGSPGIEEFTGLCRGLVLDCEEVIERMGLDWWEETVTSGTLNYDRARTRLGELSYSRGEFPDPPNL